ncbi:MAG: hypothetical protein WC725_01305 [Patescibacteria group bacterium]|jgi:hypothetical protein
MSEKNPFLRSILKGRTLSVGSMETPKYYPDIISQEEANELSWREFKERLQPLRTIKHPRTGLEYILTSKSPSWTFQDINMFVGNDDRIVKTIEDLEDDEGLLFLKVNSKIAQETLDADSREINVSIGYNVEDNLPGQHSIQTKLHSHIYVSRDNEVETCRTPVSWKDLNWFKRLSVVEPFAPLYRDFVANSIKKQKLFNNFLASQEVDMQHGYVSLQLNNKENIFNTFPDIKALYHDMQEEYAQVENIFTDKHTDRLTNRYIPRIEDERTALIREYIKGNQEWLSSESNELLYYLSKNIKQPAGIDFRNMKSANEAWLTKGFAGMINLSFSYGCDTVRFDILPRVITTSSASKVLAGQGRPTVLARGSNEASGNQQKIVENYQKRVANIIDQNFA